MICITCELIIQSKFSSLPTCYYLQERYQQQLNTYNSTISFLPKITRSSTTKHLYRAYFTEPKAELELHSLLPALPMPWEQPTAITYRTTNPAGNRSLQPIHIGPSGATSTTPTSKQHQRYSFRLTFLINKVKILASKTITNLFQAKHGVLSPLFRHPRASLSS